MEGMIHSRSHKTDPYVRRRYDMSTIQAGLILLCLLSALARERVISVCELVQHSEQYKNKVVMVSGQYIHGRHGATVANEVCGFQNRYRAFGSTAVVDAQYYDSSDGLPKDAIGFANQHSIREFDRAVARAMLDAISGERAISVTVMALVKVADPYNIHESRDGGYMGTGYGFMGRYPVQILILQVKKFQISDPEKTR